jgi:hypothetical protein
MTERAADATLQILLGETDMVREEEVLVFFFNRFLE